jgi:hypothetical protein
LNAALKGGIDRAGGVQMQAWKVLILAVAVTACGANPETEDAGPFVAAEEFGPLVRACGVPKRAMGEEVAQSPGAGTYRLFDTKPNTPEPRVQFITGFSDGCPRQVYAALTLFGAPVLHETKRYDRGNKRPYTEADNAYEEIKNRICRVERGRFCPEDRAERLGDQVAFFTAYPSFGAKKWLDVVLYRGEIAGQSIED